MKIAYIRTSTKNFTDTLADLERAAADQGWKQLGTAPLPNDRGTMVLVCRPDWLAGLLDSDLQMLGFAPCSVSVVRQGDEVKVVVSQLMQVLAQSPEFAAMAHQAVTALKQLVHTAAGVGEPQLKQVKLYSTATCPYCTMEENWLKGQKVSFEKVMVDRDPVAAENLVRATGQMGVPVTEFVYEGSDSEYVVGFDRERLQALLPTPVVA